MYTDIQTDNMLYTRSYDMTQSTADEETSIRLGQSEGSSAEQNDHNTKRNEHTYHNHDSNTNANNDNHVLHG